MQDEGLLMVNRSATLTYTTVSVCFHYKAMHNAFFKFHFLINFIKKLQKIEVVRESKQEQVKKGKQGENHAARLCIPDKAYGRDNESVLQYFCFT